MSHLLVSKIKPRNGSILIQRMDPEVTAGRIILPTTRIDRSKQAIVLAVGPGEFNLKGERVPLQCKVGDTIYMDHFSGHDIDAIDENGVPVRGLAIAQEEQGHLRSKR
jgi:chaperonin GroES